MSVVNGKGEHQAAWFGIEAGPAEASDGLYAGVVFDRPLEQVFTYRVPAPLRGAIRPGQRLRVPLGRGNRPAVGYCVRLDGALPDGVARARLKDVSAPTLLITGLQDRICCPKTAAEAARELPRGQFLALPKCGHAPQVEKSRRINRLVAHFLTAPVPSVHPGWMFAKPN